MKARHRKDRRDVPTAPCKKATECEHTDRVCWARGRCKSCYDKWLRTENPEYAKRQKDSFARWFSVPANRQRVCDYAKSRDTPERRRKASLWQRYGMTLADFDSLMIRQNGRCAICLKESKRTLHVDHCHETGNIRGLLCFRCNYGLSFYSDNAEALERAAGYLRRGVQPQGRS